MKVSVLFLSLVASCMACAEVLPFKTPSFDTKRCADSAKSSVSMEQKETCVEVKLLDGENSMEAMIPFRDKNDYSNLAVTWPFLKRHLPRRIFQRSLIF